MTFSRRRFLLRGLASGIAPAVRLSVPAVLVGSTWIPIPARAADPATIALMLKGASVAMRMVAAHNRSDGGMSALFNAVLQYERVQVGMLASIQTGIAAILDRLEKLDASIREAHKAVWVWTVFNDIRSDIYEFQQQIIGMGQRNSYQEWRDNPETQRVLTSVADRLRISINKVIGSQHRNAPVAMLLPAAVFAWLGAARVVGTDDTALKLYAQRVYAFLGAMLETQSPAEAKPEERPIPVVLDTLYAEFADRRKKLVASGLHLPDAPDPSEFRLARLGHISVQHTYSKRIELDCVRPETTEQLLRRTSFLLASGCGYDEIFTGDTDQFELFTRVYREKLKDPDFPDASPIVQYSVSKEREFGRYEEPRFRWLRENTTGGLDSARKENAPASEDRWKIAEDHFKQDSFQERHRSLEHGVLMLNETIAKIALNIAAWQLAEKTRIALKQEYQL